MVSFSTITGGINLKGYYSFIEDFKRDKVSTTFARKAEFANPWIKNINNEWVPISKANFTADANPVLNIDAGTTNGHFFLITGGDTTNTLKLRSVIDYPKPGLAQPADIPK